MNELNLLEDAIDRRDAQVIRSVLKNHPSLRISSEGGACKELRIASMLGNETVVRAFLEAAPEMASYKDASGDTALHHAAWMGNKKCVEMILEACPEAAEIANDSGQSFRDLARIRALNERDEDRRFQEGLAADGISRQPRNHAERYLRQASRWLGIVR